jgi:hypothetical protein
MKDNVRFITTLISCAAVAAAGLYGIWCFKHGLLDPHQRRDMRLILLSILAPIPAVTLAIFAIIVRNQNNG